VNALIIMNHEREGPGLLADILEEKGIRFDLVDASRSEAFPDPSDYAAVFVLGGPDSANDPSGTMQRELEFIREVLARRIPYFGICLGMQVLVKAAGGDVFPGPYTETGIVDPLGNDFAMRLTDEGAGDPVFAELPHRIRIFQLHGETVATEEPVHLLATGSWCHAQTVRVGPAAYGIQGHLEATEELIGVWAEQDADLAGLDRTLLIRDFRRLAPEFEATARKMFGNFLALASRNTQEPPV
jgi:GMP synthase-like glutamine amidotransferase